MSEKRYVELSACMSKELTEAEKAEGWHFCKEWDFMLIHNTWPEMMACHCDGQKFNPEPKE